MISMGKLQGQITRGFQMFQEIKASKKSISKRKPVCGIGINDAEYMIMQKVDGKKTQCPYYNKWKTMLERCYSDKLQARSPTYINCAVTKEWLVFSHFKKWMQSHDWQGMQLDKDIKVNGNKVYSPDACLFVPAALNALLNDNAANRGKYPIGVSLHKPSGKFQAHIRCDGKLNALGRFKTPKEASQAYKVARKEKIQQLISDNAYPMATQYLAQHI